MTAPKATRATTDLKEALVDKALKERHQDALSRYRAAAKGETARWDERFEVLAEIINSDPPCCLAGGYATTREFLKAEAPNETERGVSMGIRVAVHFDAADEQRYGITNLDALLGYLEAEAGGELGRAKNHPERQTIRIKEGGGTKSIPFAEATRAQIQYMRQHHRCPEFGDVRLDLRGEVHFHCEGGVFGFCITRFPYEEPVQCWNSVTGMWWFERGISPWEPALWPAGPWSCGGRFHDDARPEREHRHSLQRSERRPAPRGDRCHAQQPRPRRESERTPASPTKDDHGAELHEGDPRQADRENGDPAFVATSQPLW